MKEPCPEIFYLNICFPTGFKSRAGNYILVVLPKALERKVICIPSPIHWPLQVGGWTTEQHKVTVNEAFDWRQGPGTIPSVASNTARYPWVVKTFWYFQFPGAWAGISNHHPQFVSYFRVTKCCSQHIWFHSISSAKRWREEKKTNIVWNHTKRQVLTLTFIESYVIYSL